MSTDQAIEILVRFSRLVSGASDPAEILPLLADNVIELATADASAVLQVTGAGEARLVASRGLPPPLRGWHTEFETVGPELGDELLAASGGHFADAVTLPLVSTGDLFGALVLLFRQPAELPPDRLCLAEGLVDLAAITLGKAFQIAELSRSQGELRASREMLLQTEKLRALGQMAAGISHDLKNILNPLSLQVQLFKRRVHRDPAAADEVIAQIEEVVQHGLQTVERLRSFSRQSPERIIEPAEVDRILDEAAELCRPRLRMARGPIELAVHKGAPPPVLVHAPDLLNSLVNLIVNAVDAMPEGGLLTVRSGQDEGGGPVWVEVVDTGIGIPDELQRRVFEPFFTTKGKEGTGLGLAMVYAFVQRHGGQIVLESALGQGTRLRLSFAPARRPPAEGPAGSIGSGGSGGSAGSIRSGGSGGRAAGS